MHMLFWRCMALLSVLVVAFAGCDQASTTQRFSCHLEHPDGALTASSCTTLLFVNGIDTQNQQYELLAINGFDGSVRWQSPNIYGTWIPQVSTDGNTVYSYTSRSPNTPAQTDQLWAFNAETGAVRWSRPDIHYVGSGAGVTYAEAYRQDGYILYALDEASGKERWDIAIPSANSTIIDGVPFLITTMRADPLGTPVAGSGTTLIIEALNPENGAVRWKTRSQLINVGVIMSVSGNLVIAGGGTTLYALDANDGSERWKIQGTDSHYVRQALNCGQNLVCLGYADSPKEGYIDSSMDAVSANDGSVRWHYNFNAPTPLLGDLYEPLAFAQEDGLVLFMAPRHFAVINAADGTLRWTRDLSFSAARLSWGPPYPFRAGRIYLAPANGQRPPYSNLEAMALDAPNGSVRWHVSAPLLVAQYAPILHDDALFLDGRAALDTRTGRILWQNPSWADHIRITYVSG